MTIHAIIEELNADNGANHKMDVLRKHADSDLLKRVLKMTYDKATFTYGVTMKNALFEYDPMSVKSGTLTLEQALNVLQSRFATRSVTGHAALKLLGELHNGLEDKDAVVFTKIVDRDLRINMGRSNINKVFKGLIVKPVYMRCGTYNEKTAKKFNMDRAIVQLKADGTYREFNVENGRVTCISRQGEEYHYPEINAELVRQPLSAVYFGELTVYRDGKLLDRATGNGLLRKDDFPENCKVVFDCWDCVGQKEYNNAIAKIKGTVPYDKRFQIVQRLFAPFNTDPLKNPVRAIESRSVNSMAEALSYTAEVMNRGLEGTIIKERGAIFRDGTSLQQLKLKLEIDVDVRVTGFLEGTPGTVREKTFGSMLFETDDGLIKGRTSGFTNAQLEDFNSRRDWCVGKIITVTCNDITKGRDNDHHALSHPRFIEFRDEDKSETDTLARAMDHKSMAMMVDQAKAAA